MTNETLEKKEEKDEKFFFNVNIFDEEVEETDPNLVLNYNENDLTKAKEEGLQKGKVEGNKEAQESIEKEVSMTLQQLQNNFSLIMAEEEKREKKFEEEVIILCLTLFEKIFPAYHKQHGTEELLYALKNLLERHKEDQKMTVHVAPKLEPEINKLIAKIGRNDVGVEASPDINDHTCRLAWKEGGAELKDPTLLSEEMRTILHQLLEERGAVGHDEQRNPTETPAEQVKNVNEEPPQETGESSDE